MYFFLVPILYIYNATYINFGKVEMEATHYTIKQKRGRTLFIENYFLKYIYIGQRAKINWHGKKYRQFLCAPIFCAQSEKQIKLDFFSFQSIFFYIQKWINECWENFNSISYNDVSAGWVPGYPNCFWAQIQFEINWNLGLPILREL